MPRFKGQQAAAVILTDVDARPERLSQELQILFCGMTRATVRLEILCNAANPWVAGRLLPAGGGWPVSMASPAVALFACCITRIQQPADHHLRLIGRLGSPIEER